MVDVEMWDACEGRYASRITYIPGDGSPAERVTASSRRLINISTIAPDQPTVVAVGGGDWALAIETSELILLHLINGPDGAPVLMVRGPAGQWHEHSFREETYAAMPKWQADRRAFDKGASGTSRLVQLDTERLELVVNHHAGWAIRELTFRLSSDGARIALDSVERLPRDLGRKDVPEGYRDAEIAAAALEILRAGRAEEPDDIRVLESRDCPDGDTRDLARVLFGFPRSGGYSVEVWCLRRELGTWTLDEIELTDATGIDVLALLRDTYPHGTRCVQYL